MNQPTTDLPPENASAVAESIVSVPKVAAPAKKAVAKTSVKTTKPAAKSTPKPSKKTAIKTAAKTRAKLPEKAEASAIMVASAASSPAPKVIKVSATKPEKTVKPKKDKLIRDSFTMPESEYNLIAEIKRRCLANGAAVKKSEILRAAIIGLAALPDATIRAALHSLEIIKTGRPPKAAK
jgi:hypothetical protein